MYFSWSEPDGFCGRKRGKVTMEKIIYLTYLFTFLISAIPLLLTLKMSLKAKEKMFSLIIIVCLILNLILITLSATGIAEYCAIVFI